MASLETSPILHRSRVALSLLSISFHVYPWIHASAACSGTGFRVQRSPVLWRL